jgi:hypothetical protein
VEDRENGGVELGSVHQSESLQLRLITSFGHVPHSNVARAIAACRDHLPEKCVVVIRAIDSTRSSRDLACMLSGEIPFRLEHGNVCCELFDLSDEWLELHDGFEEMWIFDDGAPGQSIIDLPPLTSDNGAMDEVRGPIVADSVLATGCRIALGDGCGLEYVTREPGDEERIRTAD